MSHHSSSAVDARDPSNESKGGSILGLLLQDLQHPNPRVRALAVRECADYAESVVIDRLIEIADHDPDPEVRCTAIASLGNYVYLGAMAGYDLDDPGAELSFMEEEISEDDLRRIYGFLVSVYRDEQRMPDEKRRAVESLSYASSSAVEDMITELYALPAKQDKLSALVAMGNTGATQWEQTLGQEIMNPDHDLQIEAIRSVGEIGLDGLGKDLWRLTYAESKDIALAAIWALGQTGWEGAFDRLDELTLDEDELIRECADQAMDEWLFFNGLAQEHDEEEPDTFLDEIDAPLTPR